MLFVSHADDSFNSNVRIYVETRKGQQFYTYAASALAPFKTKANSPKQVEEFVDQFKGLAHQEFLHACFENDSNPFGSSDNRTKEAQYFNI